MSKQVWAKVLSDILKLTKVEGSGLLHAFLNLVVISCRKSTERKILLTDDSYGMTVQMIRWRD